MSNSSDRVLRTPPTNTSDNPELSFASLSAAVAPQWGETIVRLTQATDRLASRFDRFVGAKTGENTVQACRELAEELIAFLDGLEDTDEDAAVDDEACCDNELDGNTDDDEPSLGSSGHGSGGPINYTCTPVSDGFQMVYDCEGDEHDGRELENEGGEAEDDEPSLGWTDQEAAQAQYAGSGAGTCDLEANKVSP